MPAQNQPPAEEPSPNLDEHDLVKALVPDPSQGPPNATVLQGFLGKSPTGGVWRLYLTPALDEYVEIPEGDILHTQDLPDGQGTLVWVPRSLNLQHVKTRSQQVQAEFLSGSIAAGHLAAGGPSPLPAGVIPQPTPPIMPSVHMVCPTPTAIPSALRPCPVTLPFCPSEAMIHCGASVNVICPTPSAVHRCPTLPFCPSEAMILCNPSAVDACPTRFRCPTFAPEMCVSNLGCPTHAPFLCVQPTSPIHCPSHHLFCPTFAPELCVRPTFSPGCPAAGGSG